MLLFGAAPPPIATSELDVEIVVNPPAHLRILTPISVDYDARMLVLQAGKERGTPFEVQILRAGSWTVERRRGASSTAEAYSDLLTGASFAVTRDARGRYLKLTARRGPAYERGNVLHREHTGRTMNILGETCEIWQSRNWVYEFEPTYEDCITKDGVDLYANISKMGGDASSTAKALNVVRREIGPEEVRPPVNLMDWATWQPETPPKMEPNFEVRLESTLPGRGGRHDYLIIRQLGRDRYTERVGDDGFSAHLQGPSRTLWYHEDLEGRADHLEIGPGATVVKKTKRLASNDHVAGEDCSWYADISRATDGGSSQCLTVDGVPIATLSVAISMITASYRATSIRRGIITPSNLIPAKRILNWDHWR